jgi:hypothetical protein
MEFASPINTQVFKLLFRDLSRHENFNVVKLWEQSKSNPVVDHFVETNKKGKRNGKKIRKSPKLSSKEKILQRIKKSKDKKENNSDKDFIENSLIIHDITMTELKNKISIMQTEQGIQDMKMAYLKEAFKRQDIVNTIDLYIELRHKIFDNKKDRKLMDKIRKKCEKRLDMSIELYQLYKLGDRLPPLDFYNNHKFKLEEWQKRVLTCIDNRQNVFLSAPTSAGKTIIVTNSILATDYKVLIILPTEALALQVASSIDKFMPKMSNRKFGLWTDTLHYNLGLNGYINPNGVNIDILISTPTVVEQNLHLIHTKFDYLIFDEIHCLNYRDIGPSIERIIYYFPDSNFLALSATVANVDELCNWWKLIRSNTNIHIEKYNSRFINLERHIMINDYLTNLHPLALITLNELKNSENNALDELAFCPKDLAQCWMSIQNIFSEYTSSVPKLVELQPKTYFNTFGTYRITLEQTKQYEQELKKLLIKLSNLVPEKVQELLDLFSIDIHKIENNTIDMLKCAYSVKEKGLLPSLFFPSDYSKTMDYYRKMVYDLEMKLQHEWPFYLEHQAFRSELYDKMVAHKTRLDISKEKDHLNKTKNMRNGDKNRDDNIKDIIELKFKALYKKEVKKLINELIEFYETTKKHMMNEIATLEDACINNKCNSDSDSSSVFAKLKHNNLVLTNFEKYYNGIYEWATIPYVSEFERPEELCFFKIPLSDNEITHVRKILIKEVKMSVSMTNYLLVGLLYGIGIYLTGLPSSYLRFLQTCSQNRKIGIVLSDRTLSMGISMPFLSVLLYQHGDVEFVQMEAVQMMGRCGRRNRDTTGHLLLCNLDPQKLLLKNKTRITGSNIKVPTIGLLKYLRPSGDIGNITRHTIYSYCNMHKYNTRNYNTVSTTTTTLVVHSGPSSDYYTESFNSWRSQYSPHLSLNEKAVIWKTTTCFPHSDDLQGNISALCFILLIKEPQLFDLLENCNDNSLLVRFIGYILCTCYFHHLLKEPTILKNSKGQEFNQLFSDVFTNMKCFTELYGATPIITDEIEQNSQTLYNTLLRQLSDNKYICNDAKYIHFLQNIRAFIITLSNLNTLNNTRVMYAMKRVYDNLQRLILNYSLRSCNES